MSPAFPRRPKVLSPCVETLEERVVPTIVGLSGITATLFANTLEVQGTDGDDIIIVYRHVDLFVVSGVAEFNANDVRRLEIHGGPGDDYIEFDGAIRGKKSNLAVWITGGEGNDTLLGGYGSDRIDGGPGDDVIDGREGNDQIYGSVGDDRIWGSEGADRLHGGEGNDSLYGGPGADYLVGGPGRDVLQGGPGRDSFHDEFDPEQPFIDGASFGDVQQGSGGTCSILATLSAAAYAGIDLSDRISYRGDNIYRVKVYDSWMWGLFHRARFEDVYFDGTWYDHDALPARERADDGSPIGALTGDFWPTLFQRAVLQMRGIDWGDPRAVEDWAASEASAHSAILGDRNWHSIRSSDGQLPHQLREALQSGEVVTAGTSSFGYDSTGEEIIEQDGVISLHAYAVLDVYRQAGSWRITLYNPWGWDSVSPAMDGQDDGLIDLDWWTFTNRFEVYTRTKP